jgi:hypothetical protein
VLQFEVGIQTFDELASRMLQTRLIPFAEMQEMRRFAKYWDLIGNSGNFPSTLPLILQDELSTFAAFRRLSAFLWERTERLDGIALLKLAELIFIWLTERKGIASPAVANCLWSDYRPGREGDKPPRWLAPYLSGLESAEVHSDGTALPARQARHLVKAAKASVNS